MIAPLSLPFRHYDLEMYSDREEDLEALYAELAELAEEDDDELPPIIVLEPLEPLDPEDDPFWPVAATAGSPAPVPQVRNERQGIGEGT